MIGRTHGEVDTDSYWASGLLGICTLAFGIVSDNEKDSIGSAMKRILSGVLACEGLMIPANGRREHFR